MPNICASGATFCEITAATDKNCGNESKNRTKSNSFDICNVYFKKLTF
jgi:hypothetical protein